MGPVGASEAQDEAALVRAARAGDRPVFAALYERYTIDMKILDSQNETRDGVLLSDDFFDAAQYPTMTFKSVAIRPGAGPNSFDVAGDFTLHGITKRITVPVTYQGLKDVPNAGQYAGFETEFRLDRTEYGVNGTRWSGRKLQISNEVRVRILIGAMHRH
jgi:polyisoprenoid-binding protein YceI